ncbi:hypothetical protein ScPMuIL_016921 [Solemya velum]
MADENQSSLSNEEAESEDCKATRSLEDFITDHYKEQKSDGKFESTEEIDEERESNFFQRALAESRRMDAEVIKSEAKLKKLHNELGAENMAKWQAEHITEALPKE